MEPSSGVFRAGSRRRRDAAKAEIRDVPVPRCPDSRIVAVALSLPTSFTDAVTSAEPQLPAYSGVTVWAFHPLRVVTGETSVVAGQYSTAALRAQGSGLRR